MAKKRRPGQSKAGKPPPRCKAILLCDQTIIEAVTGKISVVGIFDGFVVPRMPGFTRPVTAFLQLVDGIGQYEILVEVHDLQVNHVLARAQIARIQFGDRLSKINLLIPIPPLPLQHEGVYDIVVFADDQEIDRAKFSVTIPQGPSNGSNASEEPDRG